MKKILLREFVNGTAICTPDGWVYKDHLMRLDEKELEVYLLAGKKYVRKLILMFYCRNWVQDN